MKTRNLIIVLVFAGVTAWGLGQCASSWAFDGSGRQGETGGTGTHSAGTDIDGTGLGGYCGCLGPNSPGFANDPDGLATDHEVQAQGDVNGTCGCTP